MSSAADTTDDCLTANCDPNATCQDGFQSFTCTCNEGFTGNGQTCTAIVLVNECTDGSHNCAADATCTDTVTSFTCACNEGFTGDGITCNPDVPACEVIKVFRFLNEARCEASGPITWTGDISRNVYSCSAVTTNDDLFWDYPSTILWVPFSSGKWVFINTTIESILANPQIVTQAELFGIQNYDPSHWPQTSPKMGQNDPTMILKVFLNNT